MCTAGGRKDDGGCGGKLGSGFEDGYAGGGADGDGGRNGEKGGRIGACTVAILASEKVVWIVKLEQDVEAGWLRDGETLRGCNERAISVGAESEKHAQHMSSNASNGRKRSCESRDARRAGSGSKGSRK